ncbi:hypothetical protein NBRC10513v2_004008 [Rhodotorula toruloides]
MARRDSKSWRRSRTLSTTFLDDALRDNKTPIARLRLRPSIALPATALALCIVFLLVGRSNHHPDPALSRSSPAALVELGEHPNFDFDAHLEPVNHRVELEEEEGQVEEEGGEEALSDAEGLESDDVDDVESVVELDDERETVDAARTHSNSLVKPFLPLTCEPCSSSLVSSAPSSSICAKYRPPSSSSTSPLHPDILDHSILFAGTGSEVRRVLKRAMRSALYGLKRHREGSEGEVQKFEGEEPFRILVLGGSVSNCRGVDQKTECWHAHVLRWFQRTFPMEGDRDLVPNSPSRLFPSSSSRVRLHKRDAAEDGNFDADADRLRLAKRAAKRKSKKKPGRTKSSHAGSRRRPSTQLINGSKSATGSAFFAYCFEEEMTLRRKNLDWGKGPDLVVVESGVNDVWPGGEQATRDFEKLLRTLRALPSQPAVVALEAASLLLASTTAATTNAEYDHLPAAHFYDVPVLSVKHALFGPVHGLSSSSAPDGPLNKIDDLFLPDLHHPNDRGHELLADVLLAYLEQQACLAQQEVMAAATSRLNAHQSGVRLIGGRRDGDVDPLLDIPPRQDEVVRPLPARSLFTPFSFDKKGHKVDEGVWELPKPTCIQVGNAKSLVEPVKNKGWSKLAWARDKQYLAASKPGSSVTFRVNVGSGGTILADWLHSRFYDLGDVLVYLDGDRSRVKQLAGWWDLGWSIGVPTEVFKDVSPGEHDVTFELLPASKSSHPSSKNVNFRLIGLIST